MYYLRFQNFFIDKGVLVPNSVSSIKSVESKALFTLVLEKDATFQRLVDDDFTRKYPSILITVYDQFFC